MSKATVAQALATKKWRLKNREKVNKYSREYSKSISKETRKLYGIRAFWPHKTLEQVAIAYKELLVKHPTCAICQNLCVTGCKLAVDHNHITGKVRGLLCAQCNRSLGGFKADLGTDILYRAISYIRETNE